MGQSNAALLASLQGHPGYECVQALSVVDINLNVKKKSFKISYELRDITWLMDPPATKGINVPLQDILVSLVFGRNLPRGLLLIGFLPPMRKMRLRRTL